MAQGKTHLERGHAVDAPARNEFIGSALRVRQELLSLAEREIQYVTDRQALSRIEAGKCALAPQVAVVLDAGCTGAMTGGGYPDGIRRIVDAYTVVFAGLGLNLILGVLYAWGVMGKALVAQWRWTTTQAALPFTVGTVAFSVTMIFAKSAGAIVGLATSPLRIAA